MIIQDVLTPFYDVCPEFTANDTYTSVTVPAIQSYMENVNAQKFFQRNDNIELISAGFILPEGFTLANTDKVSVASAFSELQLKVYDENDAFVSMLPSLTGRGVVAIPMENYEFGIGVFCDINALGIRGLWAIKQTLFCNNISMINLPSRLVGRSQRVIPFIKVQHTLPMVDNP